MEAPQGAEGPSEPQENASAEQNSASSDLRRAATFKPGARGGQVRFSRGHSLPDLRQLDGQENNPPIIVGNLERHSVHEEGGKYVQEANPSFMIENQGLHPVHEEGVAHEGHANQIETGTPSFKRGFWQGLRAGSVFKRGEGKEKEDTGENQEKYESTHSVKSKSRGGSVGKRTNLFSDTRTLDDSMHGSRVSSEGGLEDSVRRGGSGGKHEEEERAPLKKQRSSKILEKSNKILRSYTTHSVSRRSLSQPNPEEHPDTQNTASRLNNLSEDWQYAFYGKSLAGFSQHRSEDQSSLRSGKTGSSSGWGGESHSHYGRSTEKKRKGDWLPLIHPYSRARRDMNVLLAFCLLYILIVLPFEFCFNAHAEGLWLIADGIVTVVFMLDLFVTFRTGFVQKGQREVKDGLRILKPAHIVMEPRAITARYLKGWFTIDFISSLPWDFLLFFYTMRKKYWVLQILKSLKVLRAHRLTIVRSELRETWTAGQREFLEICALFFLTLYFSHLCACLFVGVGKLQDDPQRWIDQTKYDDQGTAVPLTDAPQIDLYIASMYFQMVSLATIGYGDIHAGITIADRAFMTVTDLFGAILMGYIVGKVSSLIILRRNRRYALRERFSTLHAYVAREQLPEWLATRLMVHLSRQWSSQIIEFSEVELVKDMTDELRSELLINWWQKNIPSSALLPHRHGFLKVLLSKCKSQVFNERDVITREGESVRHLWILKSGQLAVSRSVALDDLENFRGGLSDEERSSDSDESPDLPQDADARQLTRLSSYKRPDQRALNRLPTFNWAVDLDRGDQSDKALVTEMAAPGTIIGEVPLLLALAQKVVKDRASKSMAKGRESKKLAVKAIIQDATVVCHYECNILVLLLEDLFETLDQFPSLTHKLKRAITRADRHMKRNGGNSIKRENSGW